MRQLENHMVIGPYYDEDRYHPPQIDEDEAYERVRQIEIDEAANARSQQEAQ